MTIGPVQLIVLGFPEPNFHGEIIAELDAATVLRAVYSERQLFEVMVNFWSEHFSIWHLKEQCKILKTIDDREVVRVVVQLLVVARNHRPIARDGGTVRRKERPEDRLGVVRSVEPGHQFLAHVELDGILAEARDHLHTAVAARLEGGVAAADAESEAVESFGDPRELAARFHEELASSDR